MPGIIVSLIVTLVALSFAFYTDDSSERFRRRSQDSTWQSLKKPVDHSAERDRDQGNSGSVHTSV